MTYSTNFLKYVYVRKTENCSFKVISHICVMIWQENASISCTRSLNHASLSPFNSMTNIACLMILHVASM